MDTPGGDRRRASPTLLGDEADLFRDYNPALVRIVQRRTNAPRELVDDACAFAWQQFLQYQPDRDRNWRAWLVTTAEREAWRLSGLEARHLSLSTGEGERDGLGSWDVADERDRVAIRSRLREALQAFADLPERRREIKALQIAGYSYDEIAAMRGLTYTRVNHILAEANGTLRDQQGHVATSRLDTPARAARLDELERDPPPWLRQSIGPRPALTDDQRAVLIWRRAALVIDDYRRLRGGALGDDALGDRPLDLEAARAFDRARAAIEQAVDARARARRRSRDR